MPDYSKGKIYRLWSPSTGLQYIGSSIQELCKRFSQHKKDWKNKAIKNKEVYITSFSVMDCGDARIDLLEKYPCSSKKELERREGEWIRKLDCVNKIVAGRTRKEYREEHKDEQAKRTKIWRENHKEELKQKKKKYYEENKEKITAKNKLKRKAKREAEGKPKPLLTPEERKARIKESKRKWKLNNQAKILEQRERYKTRRNELEREKRKLKKEALLSTS